MGLLRWPVTVGTTLTMSLLWCAARRLFVIDVSGQSMEPTLIAGDKVLVLRTRRVRAGDVVAVAQPDSQGGWQAPQGRKETLMVKRVAEVRAPCGARGDDQQMLILLGDNPARSWDSRQLGPLPRHWVVGKMVIGL